MMTTRHLFLLLLPMLVLIGCSDGQDDPVATDTTTGALVQASTCKDAPGMPRYGDGSTSESCLEYSYDADRQLLTLRHVNAGFNCCPGTLGADITVSGGVITIAEREEEAGCHCNCLYDLDFEIRQLPPAEYHIVMVEPYRPDGAEVLELTVDLTTQSSGTHCVVRSTYPWGM